MRNRLASGQNLGSNSGSSEGARKSISNNVKAVVLQVIFNGVLVFILYRYLYYKLGVEQIGIWSLVLATTSISRFGDMGLSAGVVRFVAQALGQNDGKRAADIIQTVVLTIGVSMAVLLLAGYPLFTRALHYVMPARSLPVAVSILPYALASLWSLLVVGVLSGGLDGCMRMDLRGLLMGGSSVVYLGFTVLLVPRMGLRGVALAQLIQTAGLAVIMWGVLRRQLPDLPWVPWRWQYRVIRQMFSYGANYQVITFAGMLFDPVVKGLISRFAGLGALGYFEMANKLISQGRSIIVEATRVLVPAMAALQERDLDQATELFVRSHRLTFYVSAVFYGLLGVGLTVANLLWIGHAEVLFVQFGLLMNLGWYVNTIMKPAYFANMGSGDLKSNVVSHLIVLFLTPILGAGLGFYFSGLGVAMGTAISLILGSLYVLVSYFHHAGLNWRKNLIPKGMTLLFLSSLGLPVLSNLGVGQSEGLARAAIFAGLGCLPLLVLAWVNPERSLLFRRGEPT
ncbi:lipopolysaccharide biosynthesis protein [Geothrix rubra]|nr:lipopolysaccharide biosynthesis protein [Geothrix rubra]